MRGTFRNQGIKATNPVAVGDMVTFSRVKGEDSGVITGIDPRKNYLIRKSSRLSRQYQLIACNVDQVVLMATLREPQTHLEFIDRFLVSAEAYRIPARLIFNKIDLYDSDETLDLAAIISIYEDIGYPCYPISVSKNRGIKPVQDLLSDKITVLSGNSGVGKSSLLNLLDPQLNLKTNIVSNAHKAGKHTTTYAEMHELSSGGYVIDTPGIKGFGTIDIEKDELFHFFPEIFRKSQECKFYNCRHINEPGCAVIEAVEKDEISETRYISYVNLMEDMHEKYR